MGSSNPYDSKSLDSEIVKLQKSTRTTVPAMLPLHDIMRAKYKWYYNWHLMPGVKAVHTFILLLFLFFIGTVFYQFLVSQPEKVMAATVNVLPDANSTVGWGINAGCIAGAEWNCVNDPVGTPDDATSELFDDSGGSANALFTHSGGAYNGTINNVTVNYRAKALTAGVTSKAAVKIGVTVYTDSTADTLSTSYQNFSNVWSTNPATGAAWTVTEVDNLIFGFQSGAHAPTNEERVTQTYLTVDYTPAINIGGSSNGSGTVKLAVGGVLQAQTATISGGSWNILNIPMPATGTIITTWIDNVADASESTAMTEYDGTGDITGMVLNTNVLSLGSDDNQALQANGFGAGYGCTQDEDIMFVASSDPLLVEGCTNSYSDETLSILAGDTFNMEDFRITTDNLTVAATGAITQTPNYAAWTLTGNFTNSGTVTMNAGAGTINVAGNWANSGTFNAGGSTVVFNNTGAGQTISGSSTTSFNNVTLSNTNQVLSASTSFNVSGTLSFGASTTLSPSAAVVINSATAGTISGSGTARVSRTAATADYANQYKFTTNTLSSMTVEYYGAGAQSVTSTVSYGNLKINMQGAYTATAAGNLTIAGDLNVAAGTFATSTFTANRSVAGGTLTIASGATLSIGGTNAFPSNYSTHTINAASTVNYSGSNQNVSVLAGASNYGNLTFSGSGTKTLQGVEEADGSLTITGVTFTANNFNFSVAGDWANTGTFTPGNATIYFDGASGSTQNVTGSTTFNNLTATSTAARTIKFNGDSVTTVNGTWTITGGGTLGDQTKNITLSKLGGAGAWTMHATTPAVTYATVSGSIATDPICATYSTDGGSNTNWTFSAGASCGITISGTSSGYADGLGLKVAVNGVLQAQTGSIASNAWTISGVTAVNGDDITIWVDNVADANESTALAQYDGVGNITQMSLAPNVFSVGSEDQGSVDDNQPWTTYDCNDDEDIMFAGGNPFLLQGCTNSYTDETLKVLTGNTYNNWVALTAHNINNDSGYINQYAATTITLDGDLTNNGTIILNAGAGAINTSGNWINNSTFTPAGSTVTFNNTNAGQTISGSTATGFNNLTLSNTFQLLTVSTNISAAGTLTVNANATLAPNAGVVISGAGTMTGSGTAQVKTNVANAFATQYTIANKTLTNLFVDYWGLSASGQTLTDTTYGSTGSGGLKISGTLNSLTQTATVAGNFTVTGTFVPATSTITFAAGNTTIANSGTLTFLNVTLNTTATVTTTASFGINGQLYVSAGNTFTANSNSTITLGGSWTFNAANNLITLYNMTVAATPSVQPVSSWYVTGMLTVNNGASLSPTNGTITMNGTGWGITNSGTLALNSITVTETPNSQTSASFTINNTLTVNANKSFSPSGGTITFASTSWAIANSGTLAFSGLTISETPISQPSNQSFTITGTLTLNATKTFNPTGGTITLNTTGWRITNNGTLLSFPGLTISETPSAQTSANFSVKNTLTVNSGKTLQPSGGTITMSGTGWGISNSGTLVFSGLFVQQTPTSQPSNQSFTITGRLTISGSKTFMPSGGTITFSGTGWNVYHDSADSGIVSFDNLTIAGTPSGPGEYFEIRGLLTVNNGINPVFTDGITFTGTAWGITNNGTLTFSQLFINGTPAVQPSASFMVSGAITINAGKTFAPQAGTVTMTGNCPAGCIFNNGGAANNLAFYNLTSTGVNVLTASSFNISNDFIVSAGTFTASGSPTITVSGNVNFTGGGFTAASSTLKLNGAADSTQTITPNGRTLNNLEIPNNGHRHIAFAGNSTLNVGGTLTVTGAVGQLINLESTDINNWTINPTAANVSYVNTTKSNNNGVKFCATYSTDGTGNGGATGWFFSNGNDCRAAVASNVSITPNSVSEITTNWTDNSSAPAPVETGFKVWVSTAAADNCSAATYNADPDYTTAADATSQNKTGLGTNTRYCTKIVAANAFNDSDPVYAASPRYTNIDAVSGVTWGDFTTTDIAATPSNTPANLAAGTSGIKYTVRLAADDTFVDESAWQQNTNSYDPTAGLSVNTRYKFEIQSRNGDGTTTAAISANKYTRANPPIMAGHSTIATDSITWTWGKNSNPANTEFTLTDNSGGNCGWTADMSSCEGIGTKNANTQYTGTVTARNGDNVETTTAQASAYTAIETPATSPGQAITAGLITPNSIALNITDSLTNLNVGSSGIQYQETSGNPGGGGEVAFTTWPQTPGTTDAGLRGAVSGAVGTTYTYRIKARNAEGIETAQSGEFSFVTTAGTQLLFELPGETLTENGSNLLAYTDPTPNNVVAGTPFNINIKAADGANYRDLAHGDTITLSSTDSQATLPAPAAMANGSITYNGVALKTAGTQTISGSGSAGSSHEVLVSPATCSAAVSTATAAPVSLDTGATSTITVYLKDAFGNVLAGHGVSAVSDQAGDNITFSAATTDVNGRIYIYVTSAAAHVSNITISDSTDAITLITKPQITFNAPPEDVVVDNPTNFAVTAGNAKATLTWTNPASFDQIYIYRSLISGSLGVKITEKTSTKFENTGLTNGTTYYYTLKAEKDGNLSSGTNQLSATPQKPGKPTPPTPTPTPPGDTEAPSTPTNLRATSITDSSVNFIWDPSTDNVGVVGYEVYNADTNVLIGQVATAAFNTNGLNPETTYRFKVRAFDTAGNYSGYSEVLSITTKKNVLDEDDEEEGAVAFLVMGNVPKEVDAGKKFPEDIRVTAADAGGQVKADYNKAVHFTSTDKNAKLKHDSKDPYTFDALDAGIHSFKGSDFILETSGKQKLTVTDNDSSSTVEILVLSSGIINVGFEKAGQEIVDFFSNPTNVSNLNTGVVTATTALLLAPVVVNTLMSLSSLIPQLTVWFYSLLELLGIRKRRKDWGLVFNSQTGQAIPLAVIRIYDKKYNRVLEQAVADQQGRYGFLTKDGTYYIRVVKAGYTFPPKEKDSTFYEKVYTGGEFKLSDKDQSVAFNLPMDPHTKAGYLMSIWVGIVKLSKWLQKLVLPLFFVGLVVNIIILVMHYSIFYVLTLIFYVLIGVLQFLRTRKARPYGKVTDVFNKPIPTSIVRIYHKNNNRLVETDVTDKDGRFRFLVTPGVYYITATKPGYIDFKSHLMYLQKEQSLVTTTIKLKKEIK